MGSVRLSMSAFWFKPRFLSEFEQALFLTGLLEGFWYGLVAV